MFCPKCGLKLDESITVCPRCETSIAQNVILSSTMVNQPRKASGRSITAMVLGIIGIVIGIVGCGLGILLGPIALILGALELKKINRGLSSAASRTFALTGLILGIISTVLIPILAIFAAISIPNFLAAQTRSKVSRAKGEMNMIATGLEAYFIDANVYPSPGRPSFRERDSYSGDGSYAQDGGIIPIVLTTPVSYITALPRDPFRNNGKGYYGYGGGPGLTGGAGTPTIDDLEHDYNGIWPPSGWIVTSYGPDYVDGNIGTLGGTRLSEESTWTDSYSMYEPNNMQCDSWHPLVTSGLTFDPTNGTISAGDVWRRGP